MSLFSLAYTLPWLKQPAAHIFFNHHQTFNHSHQQNNINSTSHSDAENDKNASIRRNSCDKIVSPTAIPYYKNSAFKPVLGAHRSQLFNGNLFNSSLLGTTSIGPEQNNRIDDSDHSNDIEL